MGAWRLLVVAGVIAVACLATPAEAAEWCIHDPTFVVTTPSGQAMTLNLNVLGLGTTNDSAVAVAGITSLAEVRSGQYNNVTLVAYTPNGPQGVFQVNYEVITRLGTGSKQLHQVSSHSGRYQPMTFVLPFK